jgi:hypothetical protein
MSSLDDLRKAFFGAKAVGQSAAEKLSEKSKEMLDEAADSLDALSENVSDMAATARDKAADWSFQAEEWLRRQAELSDKPAADTGSQPSAGAAAGFTGQPAAGSSSQPATAAAPKAPIDFEETADGATAGRSTLAQSSNELLDKVAASGVKALESAQELGAKAMEASEKIGQKIFDKSLELGEMWGAKADEWIEKAEREAAEEAAKREQLARERADNAVRDSKSSLLDDKGGFFDKADRFARGDYHDVSISKDPNYRRPADKSGKVAGLDDHDGDGDSLIDDAVIDNDR